MNQLSGVKKKDEIIFIQKILKEITNQDLHIEYIEKTYLKILLKLKSKNKIMIAGSQGSGKSSLSKLIKLYLEKFQNKSVIIISIDDFYLSKKIGCNFQKINIPCSSREEFLAPMIGRH